MRTKMQDKFIKSDSDMLIRKKQLLAQIMIYLVGCKKISKITVNDITSRAGVTRSVFYRYFLDKNDLIFWVYEKDADKIFGEFIDLRNIKLLILSLLDLFLIHESYYKAVIKMTDQNSFREMLFKYFYEQGNNYLITRLFVRKLEIDLKFSLRSYCHCCVDMICEWILSDEICSIQEMTKSLYENIPIVIHNYFNGSDTLKELNII